MIDFVSVKRDNYTLRGLYTKAENAKAILVMFHGFTGHCNEHAFMFKEFAENMEKVGVSTLRFDFMGSGMSDGHFEEMTYFTELADAKTIVEYAISIKGDLPLYVLGYSMGGAVAGNISAIYKEKIDKLILISPAGHMVESAYRHVYNAGLKDYNEACVDMGGYLMSKEFADGFVGYDIYKGIENYPNPVLIVHGENDKAVPISYGEKYHNLYPKAKMVVVPNGDHGYNSMALKKILHEAVLDFVK